MDRENLKSELKGIRHLLSHLHGEVAALEQAYSGVLSVLRRLEDVAFTDDLTGLLRRNPFFKKWADFMEKSQKAGESCGLIILDIDHFKQVNDQHGHPTGDEVIKKVAALLKNYESPNCFSGRLGGEEFVIAVRGTDAEILGLAEFMRRGTERLHGPVIEPTGKPSEKIQWKCTLSGGVASSKMLGYNTDKLLASADEALYFAKKKGRNQIKAAA